MRGESEAIVVPVGMSPVHSFRILKSLIGRDFEMIVLAVSDQTRSTGLAILDVPGDDETETKIIGYANIAQLIERNPDIKQWNLLMGPGTRSMAITLWSEIANATGDSPRIWVDHRRKTKKGKGKPIAGEHIVNLADRTEQYKIVPIEEEDACAICGIGVEELQMTEGLRWDSLYSKFSYQITVPSDARGMSKTVARAWEEKVASKVKDLRDHLGRHALEIHREPVPSKPKFWLKIGERLDDLDIRGGSK
jgi:hypothetical protein